MKKIIFLFGLIILLSGISQAQQTLKFKKTNGSTDSYKLNDIDSIVIIQNTTNVKGIVINSIEPDNANIGDTLIINGIGFGPEQDGYVDFSGFKIMNVVKWSDKQIILIVPQNSTSGKIKVIRSPYQSNEVDFNLIVKITTTVSGFVLDEGRNILGGVTITLGNQTITTDSNGIFLFKNVTVPSNRICLVATKDGYFDMARAAIPTENAVTEVRITMTKKLITGTFNANTGKKIDLNSGASISFNPNSIVKSDNSTYSGTVNVYAKYFNPDSSNFNDNFMGDGYAKRIDGSSTYLYSYGVQNIELYSSTNEKLNLKKGLSALLSFPNNNQIPDTVPMWYFDFNKGYWQEDGVSLNNGNSHVAQVSHFTPWNCDKPAPPPPPALIYGQIISCNDMLPLKGVKVNIGQLQTTSDSYGNFSLKVGINNENLVIKVADPYISNKIILKNLQSGKTYTNNILTIGNLATIKGKLLDCNNNPDEKIVFVKWGKNGFNSCYAKNGIFSIGVEPLYQIELRVGEITKIINPLDTCGIINLDNLYTCKEGGINSYIDLVKIEAGTFRMGSVDFKQIHKVTLTKPFYLGKFEITQSQWIKVMGSNPSSVKGDNLPVTNVSWDDAIDFCNYLSEMENLTKAYTRDINNKVTCNWNANGYRLPTEAEWEYAARSGTLTDCAQGNFIEYLCSKKDSILIKIGWYCSNSDSKIHPVGMKIPNNWGLYDMHGNVSEWVWDHSHPSFFTYSAEDQIDPLGQNYLYNITRGGGYNDTGDKCSSQYRYLGGTSSSVGFRIVRLY